MQTMGVMCASLQFDCSDCHTNAGTDKVDWAADTARKVAATAAFFTAFAMLVGAFIAAVAATIAGHRRDEALALLR